MTSTTKRKKAFPLRPQPVAPQRKQISERVSLYCDISVQEIIEAAQRCSPDKALNMAEVTVSYEHSYGDDYLVCRFTREETNTEFALRKVDYLKRRIRYQAWKKQNKQKIAEELERLGTVKQKEEAHHLRMEEKELAKQAKRVAALRKRLEGTTP